MYSQTQTAFFKSFFILQFVTFAFDVFILLYFSIISSKIDYAESEYDHKIFLKIGQNLQNPQNNADFESCLRVHLQAHYVIK